MKIVYLEGLGVDPSLFEQLEQEQLSRFPDLEVVHYADRSEDPAVLIERSKDADVLVFSNIPFRKEVLEHCKNLKYIAVAFTGVDHIDIDYCKERGIAVSNASGYSNESVAELVFALTLGLLRNVLPCDQATRDGKTMSGLMGEELSGKTFGVVGLGAIGTKVAKLAQAFDCRVLAYNRSEKNLDGIEMVDLDTLLAESDIVSLHVPVTNETKKLINAENLCKMKKSALLINAARGPVIDNDALAQALHEGIIRGAGIDVFDMEPPIPSDYPLLQAPNTLFTPHVAFATKESMVKRAYIVVQNLEDWLDGKQSNIILP